MCKVSVIVPVYNVEDYIAQCLQSLVEQSLQDIEIIVVNDGTKDNSQQIIDAFVERYPCKVVSYRKENGGLSSARNFGLSMAKGEYVAFVDSDDWVEHAMYQLMYDKAKEQSFDMVQCDFHEIRSGKACLCSCKIEEDLMNKTEVKSAMVDFYPSAWNKLYKKSLLDEGDYKFKEGVWFEDVEFIYRLLPSVETIGVVHQPLYQYRIRKNSISSTMDQRIFHYIDNWNGIIAYYRERGLYASYKEILEYAYVRYLYATFIKSAAKFEKADFRSAVKEAITQVHTTFPLYQNNRYLSGLSPKNLYLKYFCKVFAYIVYLKVHHAE